MTASEPTLREAASILLSATKVMPEVSPYGCPHNRDWLNGLFDDLRQAATLGAARAGDGLLEEPRAHLERAYEELQDRYLAVIAVREAVADEPWSFNDGTLLERLEWCRWQHQIAAETRLAPPVKTIEENVAWHWACVRWYDGMLRDLRELLGLPVDQVGKARAALAVEGSER